MSEHPTKPPHEAIKRSRSLLARLVALHGPRKVFENLTETERVSLIYMWEANARPEQLPPPGDWRYWLVMAGRGFGKTRTGAEAIIKQAWIGTPLPNLIGPTAADVRDVMIEGESGILAVAPPWFRPRYFKSKRRLEWPNGIKSIAFSADEPERLRGPQHGYLWCDEMAAWRYSEAWTQAKFGLRLGESPRAVITTTPRPRTMIRELRDDPLTVVTGGSTHDNSHNLAPAFLAEVLKRYEGTTIGQQEIYARLLDEIPGALWQRSMLDKLRRQVMPELTRTVVAVDPPATKTQTSDEAGIVAAGLGEDGHAYVVADASKKANPSEWGEAVIDLARSVCADRIVAESNMGGDMVAHVLRTIDPQIEVKLIHATKGKLVRAEPVASLYEQGRCHHVGAFPDLEDEMCNYDGTSSQSSPNRMDALVYAISDLMVRRIAPTSIKVDLDFGRRASPWKA